MGTQLPASRVKTIMKSSAEVDVISLESLLMVTRATELFVKYLAKEAYDRTDNSKKLEYNALARVVDEIDKFDFLREIIPKKITVRDFKKKLAKIQQRQQEGRSSSSEDSDDSSSSGEEEGEEEETSTEEK